MSPFTLTFVRTGERVDAELSAGFDIIAVACGASRNEALANLVGRLDFDQLEETE